MSSIPLTTDGDYSTRLLIAPTRITRPFLNWPTKDTTTKIFDRLYEIDRASYTPFAALATLPAEGTADPADAAAYLVEEGEPEMQPDGTQAVRCLFAHVPPTQTKTGLSLMVNLPTISGAFPKVFGAYRIFQPDTTLAQYDAYAAQTVSSDSGAPAIYPSGGTYTLTFAGATTGALNYNDSAATVQTALNALTPISDRGNVVVTGSYNSSGGFVITFNSYATATYSLASLTGPSSFSSTVSPSNSGYTQTPSFTAMSTPWSGGTFTLTLFGQTTAAIAYNASAATVAAALNALSEVQTKRGGVTVTLPSGHTTILDATGYVISFTMQFANAVMTSSATSLTPGGSTITQAITDGIGRVQSITFAAGPLQIRTLYVPGAGHGLALTDTIYIKGGATYYGAIAPGAYTLPDANTIALTITGALAYAAAGTITEVGKRTKATYIPGSKPVPCTQITRFSTGALVPDAYQGEGDAFLQAIFAGDTTINYRVGDAAPWPSDPSPINSLTTTVLSAADL